MKKKVIKINNQFVLKVTDTQLMMCNHVKDAQDISGFTWEQVSHIMGQLKSNENVVDFKIVEVKK